MKKHEETEAYIGSGNVFEDLGCPNLEEAKAKADLARQIRSIIKKKKITQAQAAKILGIDQPRVSDIIRGKLSKYSMDRLMRFIRLLGLDIEILVKKSPGKLTTPSISVTDLSAEDSKISA